MKKIILVFLILFVGNLVKSQQSPSAMFQEIKDKAAIKEVVDTFSVLADVKDVKTQLTLFTPEATVENYTNGVFGGSLKGYLQIGDAFSAYLANFSTIYHSNGQQIIKLNGNTATATSYCTVKLVGEMQDKAVNLTHYVIYNDEFVKQDGKWLIAKRKSNFVYTEAK